ncbi:MAG: hypothetical protein RLZZ226_80 [Pseudomonadota bacterium]|jgi:hypothetical protein
MKQQMIKMFFGAIVFAVSVNATAGEPSLVGTWYGHATLVDCATQQPVAGVPVFNDYRTIGTGGTFVQSQAFDFHRSPSHGIWKKTASLTYATRYNNFRFDANSSDAFTGHAEVREVVSMAKSGKAFTATASVKVYDAEGNLEDSRCTTETAERMIFD